jgi:2-phosphoglycerate kinase
LERFAKSLSIDQSSVVEAGSGSGQGGDQALRIGLIGSKESPMNPVLCILGGCNGAGKTTLARELLPRLGLMRFLNADEPEALGRLEID